MNSMPRLVAFFCVLAVVGCAMPANLQTGEAERVRQAISAHCLIGTWRSSEGYRRTEIVKRRMGQVSKRVDGVIFQVLNTIDHNSIFVHSLTARDQDWMVVDASSTGVRDNFYFNPANGAFACSTDEWRAVQTFPKRHTFEKSALIRSGAKKPAN